jgi:hypothetical protein
MARSYTEPEASNAASSYELKPINQNPHTNPHPKPSRPSLIPKDSKPEFNLKYLRFAY